MIVLRYLTLKGKTDSDKKRAQDLLKYFSKFETVMILTFESEKLKFTSVASKGLQSESCELSQAANLLDSALEGIVKLAQSYDLIKEKAKSRAADWGSSIEFEYVRARHPPSYLNNYVHAEVRSRATDSEMHFKQKVFSVSLQITIDQLKARSKAAREINDLFSVLVPKVLARLNDEEIEQCAENLILKYSDHFDRMLCTQLQQLKSNFQPQLLKLDSATKLLNFILVEEKYLAEIFPDVVSALVLYLTIPVSVASAERSFSKLNLIKSFLRTTMTQNRLRNLAVISVESERAEEIDPKSIVERLRQSKKRRKF